MTRLLFLLALPLAAQDLHFSKSFPGSSPPYVAIHISASGSGEYQEDLKDENPLRFQMAEADVRAMLALAQKLAFFSRPLESPAKVAKMGLKTFRYEKDSTKHEVSFNYSEDLDARELLDWFEKISETERHLINLERATKYDKLGVESALLQLEVARDRKRLIAPEQMLPMLDRIIKNESYLHMARTRASGIAESIRAPK